MFCKMLDPCCYEGILGSKEHLDWLNNTHRENFVLLNSVQEFIERQTRLLLTIFVCLHNQLISVYCHKIKEYRCLKNAIHQLERNKWLLLSVFQQGFWQKLRTNFGLFLHTGKRFFLELSF